MGAWGYYDNENDEVADEFIAISKEFIDAEIKLGKTKKNENETYIQNHLKEFGEFCYQYYKDKTDLGNNIVPGICLNIMNYRNDDTDFMGRLLKISEKFVDNTKEKEKDKKKKINYFPVNLAKLALKYTIKEFDLESKEKKSSWKNQKDRLDTLKQEIKLFSNQ